MLHLICHLTSFVYYLYLVIVQANIEREIALPAAERPIAKAIGASHMFWSDLRMWIEWAALHPPTRQIWTFQFLIFWLSESSDNWMSDSFLIFWTSVILDSWRCVTSGMFYAQYLDIWVLYNLIVLESCFSVGTSKCHLNPMLHKCIRLVYTCICII